MAKPLPTPWEVVAGSVGSGVAVGSAAATAAGTAAGSAALAASGATAAGLSATGVGAIAGAAVAIGTAIAAIVLSAEEETNRYREVRDDCGVWLAPWWYGPGVVLIIEQGLPPLEREFAIGLRDRLLGGMGKAETMEWGASWWFDRGRFAEAEVIRAQIPDQKDRERRALDRLRRQMVWTAVPELRKAGVPKDEAIRAALRKEILPRSAPMVRMWVDKGRPLDPEAWACRRRKWLARSHSADDVADHERRQATVGEGSRAVRQKSVGEGSVAVRRPAVGVARSARQAGPSWAPYVVGASVLGVGLYLLRHKLF